jgi:hypothetical protein
MRVQVWAPGPPPLSSPASSASAAAPLPRRRYSFFFKGRPSLPSWAEGPMWSGMACAIPRPGLKPGLGGTVVTLFGYCSCGASYSATAYHHGVGTHDDPEIASCKIFLSPRFPLICSGGLMWLSHLMELRLSLIHWVGSLPPMGALMLLVC